jgi:hypothetical protein
MSSKSTAGRLSFEVLFVPRLELLIVFLLHRYCLGFLTAVCNPVLAGLRPVLHLLPYHRKLVPQQLQVRPAFVLVAACAFVLTTPAVQSFICASSCTELCLHFLLLPHQQAAFRLYCQSKMLSSQHAMLTKVVDHN